MRHPTRPYRHILLPPTAFDGIVPQLAICTAAGYRRANEARTKRMLAKVVKQARALTLTR